MLGYIASALLMAAATNLQALPDDRDQQIQIESQTAEYREAEGVAIYSGNVQMSQGSIELRADKLTLYAEAGEVNRLLAEGEAYYEQLPEPGAEKVIARGGIIEYILSEDVITLNKNASLTQDGATLNGHLITYDVRNHLLKANSQSGTQNERVRVILPPINNEE